MVQVRRNTKEFSEVADLLREYKASPQRRKLIFLYALKPTDKLEDRILLNKLKENGVTLYNMSYDSILQHLDDRTQKLYRDEKGPLYYFKSSASSAWIRFPFEFRGKLKKRLFPLSLVR